MRVLNYSFRDFCFQQNFLDILLCSVDKKLEKIKEKSLECHKLP